jgi:hypothetical protein
MESFAFAEGCKATGVEPRVQKVVSDDVTQELPPLNLARRADGEYDLASMAKIWKVRTSEQARAARENLYLSLTALADFYEKDL